MISETSRGVRPPTTWQWSKRSLVFSNGVSRQPLQMAGGDLLKRRPQIFGDPPVGIMRLHLPQIAVIADVIADSVLLQVAPLHRTAGDLFGHLERFENRAGVVLAAA